MRNEGCHTLQVLKFTFLWIQLFNILQANEFQQESVTSNEELKSEGLCASKFIYFYIIERALCTES